MASRQFVKVKVYKEYTYPKSMLKEGVFLQDAIGKAHRDIDDEIQDLIHNHMKSVDSTFFEYEAEEMLIFKKENKHDKRRSKIVLENAVKALVKSDMELKYGQLDPDIHPELFNVKAEKKNGRGEIIEPETFTLIEQLSNEWEQLTDKYFKILVNLVP